MKRQRSDTCVEDNNLSLWTTMRSMPKEKHIVRSSWGDNEREFVRTELVDGRKVLIQFQTGTFYGLDGTCLASSQLRIVK